MLNTAHSYLDPIDGGVFIHGILFIDDSTLAHTTTFEDADGTIGDNSFTKPSYVGGAGGTLRMPILAKYDKDGDFVWAARYAMYNDNANTCNNYSQHVSYCPDTGEIVWVVHSDVGSSGTHYRFMETTTDGVVINHVATPLIRVDTHNAHFFNRSTGAHQDTIFHRPSVNASGMSGNLMDGRGDRIVDATSYYMHSSMGSGTTKVGMVLNSGESNVVNCDVEPNRD